MMFSPQKISLTNFRAVRGTLEYEFESAPGLYFVAGRNELRPRMGPNGVAKSTVFVDAVSWALQGRTSRAKVPGADIENWAVEKGSVGVAFEFMLDNVSYTIERQRRPNKLLINGQLSTQADIDKLLPLSDAALRRTLLIDQFATMFLDLRPEDKSRIFSETLGLDVWLRAADEAGRNLTNAEKLIAKLQQEVVGYEAGLAEVRDQLEQARPRQAEFETQREERLQKLRDEKRALAATIRETTAELSKAKAKIDPAKRRAMRDKLSAARADLRKLVDDVAQLKAAEIAGSIAQTRLATQLAQYKNAKTCPECGQKVPQQHIADKRRALEAEIRQQDAVYTQVVARIKMQESRLKQLDEVVERLNKEGLSVEAASSEFARWENQAAMEERQLWVLNQRSAEVDGEANPFEASIKRLEKRLVELRTERKNAKAELAAYEDKAAIYKFWQRGFREIRLEQIDATLLELDIAANRHAEELGLEDWELQFSTERETIKGAISHKFNVTLYPPNQEKPQSWESYSGGEAQRLQLATTFGLAEVLLARAGLQTDIETLDEPTHHLSAEGIDDLLVCLADRALEHNRRILLIDHHSLDKGSFDGVITVVRDKKGVHLET